MPPFPPLREWFHNPDSPFQLTLAVSLDSVACCLGWWSLPCATGFAPTTVPLPAPKPRPCFCEPRSHARGLAEEERQFRCAPPLPVSSQDYPL